MKRSIFMLTITAFVFMALGCNSGPPSDELRATLQKNLDSGFKKGLFSIESFRRMGTHHGSDPKTGKPTMLVYFDAELKFLQSYSVANWNTLGMEALSRVLGAAPKGINGIDSEGNKTGQILNVHGTLSFAQFKGKWVIDSRDAVQAANAGAEEKALNSQYSEISAILKEYGKASDKALHNKDDDHLAILHSFLRQARNRAFKRIHGQKRNELIIATGHAAGTYYPLGSALATLLSKGGLVSRAQQSEGSIENCNLIAFGYADLAICQNDVVFQAMAGTGPFKGQSLSKICALSSWYPEPVQIVVRCDGSVQSLMDLKGRAIVIGERSSGSFFNALQILSAAGVTSSKSDEVLEAKHCKLLEIHPAAGLAKLIDGTVDAVFLTEGAPTAFVNELTRLGKVRLLSLDENLIRQLEKSHPFFAGLTLPARTYVGQTKDVRTVAVTSILIASPNLEVERVRKLLELHYANLPILAKAHPKGAAISRKTSQMGISIPMHPAATEFFNRKK